MRDQEALQESLDSLAGYPLGFHLGGHERSLFEWAEVVVVNPAVPPEAPWLEVAREEGCALTTEVNLALAWAQDWPAVAITGTHGKSTCAALTAHLLGEDCLLGGNLGGSLLEEVLAAEPGTPLVVELSSFQTERLLAPEGWPKVAIVTHLGEDHLDRHHTVDAYWAAKRRLLAFQDDQGTLLYPPDLPDAARWKEEARGTTIPLRPEDLDGFGLTMEGLPFQEPYRLPSLLAALHAARLLTHEDETLRRRIRTFPGVPHRMQAFTDAHGRSILDNGVATHPDATEAGLRHADSPTVLLAGGKDKGLDLSQLADACRPCVGLFLHGEGGRRLAGLCRDLGLEPQLHASFREAASAALQSWKAGQKLLFSPSFSSYDEFRNFRDRAELFHSLCRHIPVGNLETHEP